MSTVNVHNHKEVRNYLFNELGKLKFQLKKETGYDQLLMLGRIDQIRQCLLDMFDYEDHLSRE